MTQLGAGFVQHFTEREVDHLQIRKQALARLGREVSEQMVVCGLWAIGMKKLQATRTSLFPKSEMQQAPD